MCPNLGECWGAGTATIMILGDTCTRGCHFCNVKTGNPRGEVDWLEPKRVAEAVRELGWNYLVLTAVDRDDLADGGAPIFANTVREIHQHSPAQKSRCLTGDFAGDLAALDIVLDAQPEVLRAQSRNRRRLHADACATSARATISRCACSRTRKAARQERYTKTSLMLGLGENEAEIERRWTTRARPASTSSRWGSICSRQEASRRSSSSSRPRSSRGSARSPRAKDSAKSFRARFRAAPITPNKLFQRDQSLSNTARCWRQSVR